MRLDAAVTASPMTKKIGAVGVSWIVLWSEMAEMVGGRAPTTGGALEASFEYSLSRPASSTAVAAK